MKMQSIVTSKAGKSKAMPFLSQPENLDGSMAGDVGFDPLGFSNYIDVKWLREAELKHGRICMLAWTGCIVQVLALCMLWISGTCSCTEMGC
jgi:hypothetical protein